MNTIHKAYQSLGLDPGTPFEAVKRRYKTLVFAWHPDRMTNMEGRHEAEEELKKINHHFHILKSHFENHHRQCMGCECQPNTKGAQETNTSSASSGVSSQQRQEWEAEQKRKQEEQARQAREGRHRQEQEETQKAEEQRRAAEASKKAMQELDQQRQRQQQDQLRWRIAAAIALAYFLVIAPTWLISGAKDLIAGIQAAAGQSQPTRNATATPSPFSATKSITTTTDTSTDTGSYLPLQYHIPGKDLAWCRKFYEDESRRLHERQEQERQQDIIDAKHQIDRHQKAIDACNSFIADIQAKLWDPGISSFDKQKLQGLLEFRQGTLAAEQAGLHSAQESLCQLLATDSEQQSMLPLSTDQTTHATGIASPYPLRGGFFGERRLDHSVTGYTDSIKFAGESHG